METTNEAIERLKDEGIIDGWKTPEDWLSDRGFFKHLKCGTIYSFKPKKWRCGLCENIQS
jgi:hypothetical protein